MSKKILIVDDEINLVKMISNRLLGLGYEVVTAYTGEEGVETAKKEKPDLMLLDLWLPKMNGFEVLTQMKAVPETQTIPVVMLTVQDMKEDIHKAMSLGAADYVIKPFVPENLVAKIKQFCPLGADQAK